MADDANNQEVQETPIVVCKHVEFTISSNGANGIEDVILSYIRCNHCKKLLAEQQCCISAKDHEIYDHE